MTDATREEVWEAMDEDTQNFAKALLAPFDMEIEELVEVAGNPRPVKQKRTIRTRLTIQSIELVNKNMKYETVRD